MPWALLSNTFPWTTVSILGFAFTCTPPRIWDDSAGSRMDKRAFYTFELTGSIIDIALIVVPSLVVWKLQLQLRKKLTIISVLASRPI